MKTPISEVLGGGYSDDYDSDSAAKEGLAGELADLLGLKEDKAKQLAEVICKLAKLEAEESEGGCTHLSITVGK